MERLLTEQQFADAQTEANMNGPEQPETYRFEDGIPLPPAKTCEGARIKYAALTDMKVGQSFLLPPGKRGGLSGHLNWAGKRTGMKFAYRKRVMQFDGEDGYRVWRIS